MNRIEIPPVLNTFQYQRNIQWLNLFTPGSVDAVLTEHVVEHLTFAEVIDAARNVFECLKPGGYWRIAVPDEYNRDANYQNWNAPGGEGQSLHRKWIYEPDEPDHQLFWNIETLSETLKQIGFTINPLEFYGRDGIFYKNHWRTSDGEIHRSYQSRYLKLLRWFFNFDNTSLIIDAVKPVKIGINNEF